MILKLSHTSVFFSVSPTDLFQGQSEADPGVGLQTLGDSSPPPGWTSPGVLPALHNAAPGVFPLWSLCAPLRTSQVRSARGILLAGRWPHLTLIQRRVLRLPVHHTEGDTLGVGGEDPADGEACLGHGDGDEAIGTGPHKQLPVALPEVGDLFHREG